MSNNTPGIPAGTGTRSLRLALRNLVAVGVGCGGAELALTLLEPAGPGWAIAAFVVVAWAYLAAGIAAWWLRPSNRIGAVMLLGCWSWLLANLINTNNPLLIAVGTVVATLPLAVVVHLLHAFPGGRLVNRAARWTVTAGYITALLLQAPQYLFRPDTDPYHLLWVADRSDLVRAGSAAQSVAGAAVMIATVVLLGHRLRHTSKERRRILIPFLSYGMIAVLFIVLSPNVIQPLLALPPATSTAMQLGLVAGLPVAFAVGVLHGTFARTGEIQELGSRLGAATAYRSTLAETLGELLGDPSLLVGFSQNGSSDYIDASGQPVIVPMEQDKGVVPIELGGRRVGVIVFDATLIGDADAVREAAIVVAMAADRERLTAELRASRNALWRSRERIVEAGDRERRRIAQDLHDGLQMRLLLLAVQAQEMARHHPDAMREVAALSASINDAVNELRHIVQSIMPAALIELGLAAAIEDLTDKIPVETTLKLDLGSNESLSPHIQRTAYFIVSEALTNALKHARASRLSVHLVQSDEWLTVEIRDNGIGGSAAAGGGRGLVGIADRADVLGGQLSVVDAAGGGTIVRAELPCAS